MTTFWTIVGVAAWVAAALPWDGASSTDPAVATESLGWTPNPTQPPLWPYDRDMVPMPGKHIFDRGLRSQLCGYVAGEWAWSCVYSLATCTTSNGWLGCCYTESTRTNCLFETTCIDSAAQSSCGSSCLSNRLMVTCSRSTAPFCALYTNSEAGVSGWGCDTSSGLTEFIVVNDAITQTRGPVTTTVSRTEPLSTDHASARVSVSESSPPAVTSDSSKSNVGAIAGGAVGGFAVVVLGGLGLMLVLSRRNKNATTAAAPGQTAYQPSAPPAQPMIQQPPMLQTHPGGHPNQNWNNQVYASVAQPQMMPQQQSHQAKYADSEVATPVSGPSPHGAQPQLQGYYAQQPQQLPTSPPTYLSDGH